MNETAQARHGTSIWVDDGVEGAAQVASVTVLADYMEEVAVKLGAEVTPSAGVAITFAVAGAPTTIGASSTLALTVDLTQYSIGTGPCLHALQSGQSLYVADLGSDSRWGDYGRKAAELGAACCVSVPVRTGDEVPAVVKAYSSEIDGLTDDQQHLVRRAAVDLAGSIRLAQHLVRQARALDERAQAMSTRRAIDLALGILMERNSSTSVEAFELLRRYSQTFNVKLRDAAQNIVVAAGDPPDGAAPFTV